MKTILISAITILLIIFQMTVPLPWWSFTVVVFALGVLIPTKKWKRPAFAIGFLAGFLSWVLPQLYYEMLYDGEIMDSTATLIGIPYLILLLGIGVIGGVLSGLAFLSGSQLRAGKQTLELELD